MKLLAKNKNRKWKYEIRDNATGNDIKINVIKTDK